MTRSNHFRIRALALAAALVLTAACGEKKAETPPVTQRQRDSLIGASSIPGAKGVKGALAVQDSAARQRARLDSIAKADSR